MNLKLYFIIFFIVFERNYVFANSKIDVQFDPNDIDENDILWHQLFNKINTLVNETSKLSENIEKLNIRLTEQEGRLTNFIEKTETEFVDLNNWKRTANTSMSNIMENMQSHFKDLENVQKDSRAEVKQFMEKLQKQSKTMEMGLMDLELNKINEWITILRRYDGSLNFNRNWTEYKMGFGNPDGEFFIGLEQLHQLTTEGAPKELLVILKDFENDKRIAKYDHFRIGNEREKYILEELGTYSGDATDSLGRHKGKKFSTYDQDNDTHSVNCAAYYKGGWWYYSCYLSNLCGQYRSKEEEKQAGIGWNDWKGKDTSLKYAEMKIRSKFA